MSGKPQAELEPLGRRIRALRGNLTQIEAAERADISSATWQHLELAKHRANSRTLKRISRAFGGSDWESLWKELMELSTPTVPLEERFTNEELDRLAVRLAPFLAEALVPELERLLSRRK